MIPRPLRRLGGGLLIAWAATHLAATPTPEVTERLDSLIEAERAFSGKSQADGTRAAFLAFLAEDSILFEPGPVDGLEVWRARAESEDLLTWSPAYADISHAGDLGYTTGPWTYKSARGADTKPSAHGQFLSIWKTQADGTWKVVLDIGTTNPAPAAGGRSASTPPTQRATPRVPPAEGNAESARDSVLALERSFAEVARSSGAAVAYQGFIDPTIRLLRQGAFPVVGLDAARVEVRERKGAFVWLPSQGHAAASGDLAYVYGDYRVEALDPAGSMIETGSFVRLWKVDLKGRFRLVVEVLHARPQDKSP